MNPITFYIFAKQAAEEYLTKGSDLNASIAKIAEDKGLSQVQIQRVVELTNHETNDQLRKTAEDKTFSFPIASVDSVLSLMNAAPPTSNVTVEKVASLIRSFNKGTGNEDFKERVELLKRASEESTLQIREAEILSDQLIEKIANASTALEARRISQLQDVMDEMENLVKVAKEFILVERGTLGELRKFAKEVEPGWEQGWDAVFNAVRSELLKLGHPFTGKLAPSVALKADNPNRPGQKITGPSVTVVNGNNPLAYEVKKVKDKITQEEHTKNWKTEIDDWKEVVQKNKMSLRDNKDVKAYIETLNKAIKHPTAPEGAFSRGVLQKLGFVDPVTGAAAAAALAAGQHVATAGLHAGYTKMLKTKVGGPTGAGTGQARGGDANDSFKSGFNS